MLYLGQSSSEFVYVRASKDSAITQGVDDLHFYPSIMSVILPIEQPILKAIRTMLYIFRE